MNLDLSQMAKAASKRSAFLQEEEKLLGSSIAVEFRASSASGAGPARVFRRSFHSGEEAERLKVHAVEQLGVEYDAVEMRLGAEDGKVMLDPLTIKEIVEPGTALDPLVVHVAVRGALPSEDDIAARTQREEEALAAEIRNEEEDEDDDDDDDEA